MRDELLEHRNRTPFLPFQIMLTSGEWLEVGQPTQLAVGENVVHLMFPKSDRYFAFNVNQIAVVQAVDEGQ